MSDKRTTNNWERDFRKEEEEALEDEEIEVQLNRLIKRKAGESYVCGKGRDFRRIGKMG